MAISFAGGTDRIHYQLEGFASQFGCTAFWVKTTQATSNVALATFWNSSNRYGWGMILGATGLINAQGWTSGIKRLNLTTITPINDGNWHHVAFNYSKDSGTGLPVSNSQIWIDGVQDVIANSSADWGETSSANFYYQLGDNSNASWASFIGDIAEVGFWDGRKLVSGEIIGLSKGISPTKICQGNLIIYAPMVREYRSVTPTVSIVTTGTTVIDHPRVIGGTA